MAVRETAEQAHTRWQQLELIQQHYARFEDLLIDVIEDVMGFKCTDIQIDIGAWISGGPKYRMVQAQRGQAKTTITAAYAVWRLIHNPTTRVLIISAGEDMAVEIGNWIIQILNNMPELECLRGDRTNGDRVSVEAYDVHYSLKGPEKSPSIRSMGITANLQGKRADLLIADDIESQKNSQTQVQRQRIEHLTRDFVSINTDGDIVWLGTPQSIDSLYNGLPSRGVAVRIWPGRYPTEDEEKSYGTYLAPLIKNRMAANPALRTGGGPLGERGQAVDPIIMGEDILNHKEVDQGASYFQLQHMLSTALSDADRFPLKLGNIRFLAWDRDQSTAPMHMEFSKHLGAIIVPPQHFPITDSLYRVSEASEFGAVSALNMYVDPTGGGAHGDELAYAVTGMCAGRVFVYDFGGIRGGLGDEQLDWLTSIVLKWPKLSNIQIEENFGKGALRQVWQPRLMAALAKANRSGVGIEDIWETGQKELRIIDVLEPIIGAGKLVIHEDLLRLDIERCQKYPADTRQTYSLFWQLARITREKGALIHDDRLDALAAACRVWVDALAIDDDKAKAAAKNAAYRQLMKNPLGDGRPMPAAFGQTLFGRFVGQAEPNALSHVNRQPGRVLVRGNRF